MFALLKNLIKQSVIINNEYGKKSKKIKENMDIIMINIKIFIEKLKKINK